MFIFKSILSTLLVGSLIGSITSIGVFCFLELIKFFSSIIKKKKFLFEDINTFLSFDILIYVVILPVIAGLLVGTLRKLGLGNRWHGPPDVILSAHT